MITTINAAATGVVVALGSIGLFAGVGAADLLSPKERSMALVELKYEDGYFYQTHKVEGGTIKGSWAAQISRAGKPICSGGASAPYETGVKHFKPDEWTDDDCPELEAGDVASAVWEYKLRNGATVGITGTVIIEKP